MNAMSLGTKLELCRRGERGKPSLSRRGQCPRVPPTTSAPRSDQLVDGLVDGRAIVQKGL